MNNKVISCKKNYNKVAKPELVKVNQENVDYLATKGIHIGKNVKMEPALLAKLRNMFNGQTIKIGNGSSLRFCTLEGAVDIGQDCIIGDGAHIKDSTLQRDVTIGDRTIIHGTIKDDGKPTTTIHKGCTINEDSYILNSTIPLNTTLKPGTSVEDSKIPDGAKEVSKKNTTIAQRINRNEYPVTDGEEDDFE